MAQVAIFRGDTPTIRMTVTDTASNPTVPFNLTGWSGQFYAKKQGGGTELDKAVTLVDASSGIVEVKLTTTDTAVVGTYDCELEIRQSGDVLTVGQFTMTVSQDFRSTA